MCFQKDVAACPYANNAEYVSGVIQIVHVEIMLRKSIFWYFGICAFLGLGKKQGIKNVEIRFTM